MSEEELIFLVMVTVVMPVAMAWLIFNYQKARMKIKQGSNENSLTTSELDSLIDDSVHQATGPLHDRLDELERKMLLLDTAHPSIQDALDADPPVQEAPAKTLGKARS